MARPSKAKQAVADKEEAEHKAGVAAQKKVAAEAKEAAVARADAERKAAEETAKAQAAEAAKKAVTVVLAPGWVHDPYRLGGGVVIHSGEPTDVRPEVAEYLVHTFPDAFSTVQK